MALKEADIANFETLKKAFDNNDVALLECTDAKTGEYRAVICAATTMNGEGYGMVPFGHLCTGNPFNDYIPPIPMKH